MGRQETVAPTWHALNVRFFPFRELTPPCAPGAYSDMPVLMPQCLEAVLRLQGRVLGEMFDSLHQL